MNSTTSLSLLPEASCSRIWFLRSTASGALESASVWFWHTRQRNSLARLATRRSSSVLCPSAALAHSAATIRQTLPTGRELLHQRPDLLLRDLGGERADVL